MRPLWRRGGRGRPDGICGVAEPNGRIHRGQCAKLVKLARGKAVFHRAFDFVPDPFAALEELIDGEVDAECRMILLALLLPKPQGDE